MNNSVHLFTIVQNHSKTRCHVIQVMSLIRSSDTENTFPSKVLIRNSARSSQLNTKRHCHSLGTWNLIKNSKPKSFLKVLTYSTDHRRTHSLVHFFPMPVFSNNVVTQHTVLFLPKQSARSVTHTFKRLTFRGLYFGDHFVGQLLAAQLMF